jgi:hypothetical protein
MSQSLPMSLQFLIDLGVILGLPHLLHLLCHHGGVLQLGLGGCGADRGQDVLSGGVAGVGDGGHAQDCGQLARAGERSLPFCWTVYEGCHVGHGDYFE